MKTKIDLQSIDWPDVLQRFGVDGAYLKKKQGPCPMHPNQGRTKFRFDNKGGQGTWICNDCGAGGGFSLLRKFTGYTNAEIFRKLEEMLNGGVVEPVARKTMPHWAIEELTPEEKARRRLTLKRAWKKSTRVKPGSSVHLYLQSRVPGLRFDWISRHIHAAVMPFFEEDGDNPGKYINHGNYPVMLGAAIRHDDGTFTTLHRTYLTQQGTKAPFAKVKKQMQSFVKLDGGAIRVNTAPDGHMIYVCEGIETAFAIVAMTGNLYPVYSALNAGNLGVFRAPAFAQVVVICADHDHVDSRGLRPGIDKAKSLMTSLSTTGRRVILRVPQDEGQDWADVYFARHGSVTPPRKLAA
jgi:putative DNA primase/helicase